jgi:hypothetical protein
MHERWMRRQRPGVFGARVVAWPFDDKDAEGEVPAHVHGDSSPDDSGLSDFLEGCVSADGPVSEGIWIYEDCPQCDGRGRHGRRVTYGRRGCPTLSAAPCALCAGTGLLKTEC